jgi:hypothetical protein
MLNTKIYSIVVHPDFTVLVMLPLTTPGYNNAMYAVHEANPLVPKYTRVFR